jgi:hypothetical protein
MDFYNQIKLFKKRPEMFYYMSKSQIHKLLIDSCSYDFDNFKFIYNETNIDLRFKNDELFFKAYHELNFDICLHILDLYKCHNIFNDNIIMCDIYCRDQIYFLLSISDKFYFQNNYFGKKDQFYDFIYENKDFDFKKINETCMICYSNVECYKINCNHFLCKDCIKDGKFIDCPYCTKTIEYNYSE